MSTDTAPARVIVDVGPLTEADVVAVARHGAGVELSAAAHPAIAGPRGVIDALANDPPGGGGRRAPGAPGGLGARGRGGGGGRRRTAAAGR